MFIVRVNSDLLREYPRSLVRGDVGETWPTGFFPSVDFLGGGFVSIVNFGVPGRCPAATDAVALSRSSENRTLGVASLFCDSPPAIATDDTGSVAALFTAEEELDSPPV